MKLWVYFVWQENNISDKVFMVSERFFRSRIICWWRFSRLMFMIFSILNQFSNRLRPISVHARCDLRFLNIRLMDQVNGLERINFKNKSLVIYQIPCINLSPEWTRFWKQNIWNWEKKGKSLEQVLENATSKCS